MGNRGILHNNSQEVVRYHQHKHWIICKLSFHNRHRPVMTPHRYTELFFLDEATALAAGHRPCAECNRTRYNEFLHYWHLGNPKEKGKLDDVLHRDRFVPYKNFWRAKKKVYTASIDTLPNGTFIMLNPDPTAQPYLVQDNLLVPWSFNGYEAPFKLRTGSEVVVLTPYSTVNTLAAGYQPKMYPNIF